MTIPLLGWLAIPTGLYLFVVGSPWLYRLTIFFVPFSATSVLVLNGANSNLPVLISVFFGVLWIVRLAINALIKPETCNMRRFTGMELLLTLFLGSCYLSMLIPVVKAGELFVFQLDTNSMVSLGFGGTQVIHLAQITYGLVFSMMLGRYNSDPIIFMQTLKIFMLSLLFVAVWGFFEVGSFYLNFDFPYFIFNNSPAYAELADNFVRRVLWDVGLARMASVADEPSILAQTLLVGLAIIFVCVLNRHYMFDKWRDRAILMMLITSLILTGSASGLIGFIVLIISLNFITSNIKSYRLVSIVVAFLIVAAGYVIYLTIEPFNVFMNQYIINKLETDSGIERLLTISMAWQAFDDSPLLGVGWGSVTSMDLIVRLLSNVGVVGAAVFMLFLIFTTYKLLRDSSTDRAGVNKIRVIATAISIVSFISYWAVVAIVGWSIQFQISYFVIGMALAAGILSDPVYKNILVIKIKIR